MQVNLDAKNSILIVVLAVVLLVGAAGGEVRQGDLADALLDLPAPLRDWKQYVPWASTLTSATDGPPADAPLPVLAHYWRYGARGRRPSAAIKIRLLEAAEENPGLLNRSFLELLPGDLASVSRVKAIYDAAGASAMSDVRQWLMRRGPWYRDELVAAANRIRYDEKAGEFTGEDALRALALLDPARALDVLALLAKSSESRLQALADAVAYDIHVRGGDERRATPLRSKLLAIARDRRAAPRSRSIAIAGLLLHPWDRRASLFRELLSDPSVNALSEGHAIERPLLDFVERDPDQLIPELLRSIESPNVVVRANAVACLAQFDKPPRFEALRPLVPLLAEHALWSRPGDDGDGGPWYRLTRRDRQLVPVEDSIMYDRTRVLYALAEIDVPHSAMALGAVLGSADRADVIAAAKALQRNSSPEAVSALRKALVTVDDRREIVHALAVNKGVDSAWAAGGVEQWLQVSDESVDPSGHERPESPEESVGRWLSIFTDVTDTVADAVYKRAAQVEAERPVTARRMRDVASRWRSSAADRQMLARLAQGTLGPGEARCLLDREGRPVLSPDAVANIARGKGVGAGLAASLSMDEAFITAVLAGTERDADAVRGLLAGSRLRRRVLPLGDVGRLVVAPDKRVAFAAERYLEALDTPEARAVLRRARPDEFLVFGARMNWDPGHFSFRQLDQVEQDFVFELTGSDAPEAIYALVSGGYWSSSKGISIHVRGDSAELIVRDDPAHYGRRTLDVAELTELRSFLAAERVEELPALDTLVNDGRQVEFLALDRSGGYRVFMNNPGSVEGPTSVYSRLTKLMDDIARRRPLERVVAIVERVPGSRLLWPGRPKGVSAVWASGDDVRVAAGDADSWRHLSGGRLTEEAARPDIGAAETRCKTPASTRADWRSTTQGGVAVAGGREGLWLCPSTGEPPKLIARQWFGDPVVTPDGRYAVVSRTDTNWADPNVVVVVDLKDGQQKTVPVPPADTFEALAWLPAHSAVLLYRDRDRDDFSPHPVGPDVAEYRLLDPATGESRIVSGDFRPLMQKGWRPPQPTGRPDEVWAALPVEDGEGASHDTIIGRYDVRRFAFTPVMRCPEIRFWSSDVWIDDGRLAYIAYRGLVTVVPIVPGSR